MDVMPRTSIASSSQQGRRTVVARDMRGGMHSMSSSRSSTSSGACPASSRKRGLLYRRSKAFLHFHEDVSGLHADVRITDDFERLRVVTLDERERLLALVRSL
jgi:hypothetical protein